MPILSFWEPSPAERRCEELAARLAAKGLSVAVQTGRGEPRLRAFGPDGGRTVRADPHRGGFALRMEPARRGGESAERFARTVSEAERIVLRFLAEDTRAARRPRPRKPAAGSSKTGRGRTVRRSRARRAASHPTATRG